MIENPLSFDGSACNCIAYPCYCDSVVYKNLPYSEPSPIIDPPLVTPTPILPVDTQVTAYPPTVNVTVATQTPTTQQAIADEGQNADGETMTIFGYPWYYAAAAAAALLLLSSGGSKRR